MTSQSLTRNEFYLNRGRCASAGQRPMDQIASAFDMLEHYDDGAAKVVIRVS